MNTNLTDISIILDSSGSMSYLAKDTIGGYNSFLKSQKEQPGKANLTFVQFDSVVRTVYDAKDLKDVPELDSRTYSPNGYTALLDAIGMTITNTGKRLADMKEKDRPAKIIFVIMTDGEENSSREYTNSQINEMITHQSDVYKWEFIFIGANQDAIKAGGNLGIKGSSSMTYSANALATQNVFETISTKMSMYRGMDASAMCSASFFDADDRTKAMVQ